MYTNKYLLILIIFAHCIQQGWGQNSNSLTITERSSSIITMSEIQTAGAHNEMVVDNTQWINYSIITNPTQPLQSISVSIGSGTIPPGVEIYLEASPDNGFGSGKTGRPTGKVRLSDFPQVLINDIGTSNTGSGRQRGHKLTITIVVSDYGLVQPGDSNLFLQYTLNQ